MGIIDNISTGFLIACLPMNLLYCFVGVLIGTLTGVLPGFGPVAATSLLLPVTFGIPPVSAIILLAGIYYGAMYGGSTTSILINIPGEAASVVTSLEGYPMAKQGRAGPALGMAAFGSLIGGTAAIVGLMLLAPPLAEVALKFGPPEFFSLMLLGLTIVTYVSSGSVLKALMMAALGLMLGSIGTDLVSGSPRLTMGIKYLLDGLPMIPVVMGLFGISEVLLNLETTLKAEVYQKEIKNLLPTLKDWAASAGAIIRGTFIGFFLGLLPGAGPVISSFASYAVEKRVSKHPEKFGTGVIEGVAGPETANNAAAQSSFIPLLTLGIPATPTIAILLGAFIIHGVQPGPLLIANNPNLFWGVVASMYLGNVMLVILNLPLIGVWVRVVLIPYVFLCPLILVFCLIGAFSINGDLNDIYVMLIFSIIGYLMKKFDYEAAPLILAFILGPLLENAFRQSLIMSRGEFHIFLERPISLAALLVAAVLLLAAFLPWLKSKRPALGVNE
jgi:putative tricarboxylic transport membrane protein